MVVEGVAEQFAAARYDVWLQCPADLLQHIRR
jgi:hypothetical protein